MNTLRPWCYRVPILTAIKHEIHTTHFYNTPIKHVNRKSRGKEKLAFIEIDKRRHTYPDSAGIQFILDQKTNRAKGMGNRKTD